MVRVDKTYVELLEARRRFEKPPKSAAGIRTVAIPRMSSRWSENMRRSGLARSCSLSVAMAVG